MSTKDKLIFLDIDGVVNTIMLDIKPFEGARGIICVDGFYYDMCSNSDGRVSNRQAIMWLNKLCKETGAKIVISSTWRFCEREGEPTTEDCLRNSGLLPEIEIIGKTPRLGYGNCRGDEILTYLQKEFPQGVYSYVILDDDADMGECIDALVQCEVHRGFGYPEYKKALDILNQ